MYKGILVHKYILSPSSQDQQRRALGGFHKNNNTRCVRGLFCKMCLH
jgi:hypothetical protein